MRNRLYAVAAIIAALCAIAGNAEARGKKAGAAIAREHAELRADRDCAVIRTVGEIAWVFTPVVPIFTTPCNLREVERAERALRAFQRKHRIKSDEAFHGF